MKREFFKYKGAYVLEKAKEYFILNPYFLTSCNIKKINGRFEDSIASVENTLTEDNILLQDEEYNNNNYSIFFTNKERYNFNRLTITQVMSYNCNCRCIYCMQQNTFKDIKIASTDNIVEGWKRISDVFDAKEMNLALFGGEPFLDIGRVEEMIIKAKEMNLNISNISAVTNGTICDDNVIKVINKYNISFLQITIDGMKEIHDKRRVLLGKSSYDIIISNILKIMKKTDANIIINTVMDKSNKDNYIDMVEELCEIFHKYIFSKTPRIIFNLGMECHPMGKSEYTKKNIIKNDELDDYYQNILKLIKLGVAINSIIPTSMCISNIINDVIVAPDGDIYNCITGLGSEKFKICSAEELIENPSKFLVRSIKFSERNRKKECIECEYKPFCNGGCQYNAFVENNSFNQCQKSVFDKVIPKIIEVISEVEEIPIYGKEIFRKVL